MKRLATVSLVLTMMAALVSCGPCYKKMQKNKDQIQVTCVPEVLTLKGSSVTADVTVTFPPMYFNPETILKITPVLVYEGGQLEGTPKYVQGEDVLDNYTAISRFDGGSYTQTVSFPFEKACIATLELRIEAKCFDECKETDGFAPLTTIAAAKGISAIQNLARGANADQGTGSKMQGGSSDEAKMDGNKVPTDNNGTYSILSDNFQRSSVVTKEAEIRYDIQSSVVKKNQLSQDQIKLFKDFVVANKDAQGTQLGSVYAAGYASPDGPEELNNTLSAERSQTGAKAMKGELKDVKGLNYEIASYGEDWDGFKTLVEQSNIQDKDLILNVLQMYSSPVERDKEIKNMSQVFKVLAEEVLPQLRRTRFTVQAANEGMSDQEILSAAKAGDTKLNVEQMLHAATLTNSVKEKIAIYQLAANTYGDARAYNNLGVFQASAGQLSAAKASFEKAASIQADPTISNNQASVAVAMGDYTAAKQFLASAGDKASKEAEGTIALSEGNYQQAKKDLTGYNLAIAELCDNNIAGAKAAIADAKGADADYVRAIIANREGDTAKALAYLKSSIAADPSFKAQAQNDIEFYDLLQANPL